MGGAAAKSQWREGKTGYQWIRKKKELNAKEEWSRGGRGYVSQG